MLDSKWFEIIKKEEEKPYFKELRSFIDGEYETKIIYPPKEDIFKAFELTPFYNVKVVIIGQDPYHNPNQAQGVCFSVPKGEVLPPSLRNIFKELENDLGIRPSKDGELIKWAKEGVLLLNAILTVEAHKPLSHAKKGWEVFTEQVIKYLNEDSNPKVFILWGGYAKDKAKLITNPNHLVLEANHPSPLSSYRGFFGCKHFSLTNKFLKEHNREPINWEL